MRLRHAPQQKEEFGGTQRVPGRSQTLPESERSREIGIRSRVPGHKRLAYSALVAIVLLAGCAGAGPNLPTPAGQPPSEAATSAPPTGLATSTPAPSPAARPGTTGQAASKPDYTGIWGIWGSGVSAEDKPWLKGHVVAVGWEDIETADNQFDWSKLDKKIDKIASQNLYVMVLIYTGSKNPEWLYSTGVPRVQSDNKGGSSFAFYLNDNNGDGDGDDVGEFRYYFKRMIAQVAQHLTQLNSDASLPTYRKIIAIQGPIGASGDPQPYERKTNDKAESNGWFGEGTPYAITKDEWDAYQKEMFLYYYNLYKTTNPPIHTLLNIGDDKAMYEWGLATLPGVWVKYGRIGDRYQHNREYNNPDSSSGSWMWEPVREFLNGVAHRSRSEMDLNQLGWFGEAPLWNMYWTNLWDLHTGLDMHNILEEDLANPAYAESFAFFSKYAGYKDPRDSTGVWIALRDGLDASDTDRFPERVYGSLSAGRDKRRYLGIAQAMAPYGARQDDPDTTIKTSFDALNDVGWQIFPGNYQLWLSQIDPNGTSQGLWRVGPQSQPYGRFARRFDSASGKDAMYFDIDDRFFSGQPLNGAYPVTIRVVYLDAGTGQWALKYDAQAEAQKTGALVTKTNSGQWKELTVTVSDGNFGNRAPNKSDIMLVNLDKEDDIFHMIELTRAQGFRTNYFGDTLAP